MNDNFTTWMLPIVIIVSIVFVGMAMAVVYDIFSHRKLFKRKSRKPWRLPDEKRMQQLKLITDEALNSLHCDVEWEDDGDDKVAQYQYQNGHFRLRLEKNSPFVKLSYLFCLSSTLDKLTVARIVANRCNIISDNVKVVYSINDETNEVNIHLLSSLFLNPDSATDMFAETMAAVFSWQNALVRKMGEVEHQTHEPGQDVEEEAAMNGRVKFLLRQQEMRLQKEDLPRLSDKQPLAIGEFLEKALGLPKVKPIRLELIGATTTVLEDSDVIWHFNLDSIVQNFRGEGARGFASAMLWVELSDMPTVQRQITFAFTDEGKDEKSDYFRVTATLVPLSANTTSPYRQQHLNMHSCSVILAHDNISRKQEIDEANYMWKEALQKMRNGEDGSLSAEQQLLLHCTDEGLARLLYKGRKLFLKGRFYEALLPLEQAFEIMQPDYDGMKSGQKEIFYEVIYHIGFCYSELKLYAQAKGYLEMLMRLNNISFTTEMINCMVNSGDFRALMAVDSIIGSINDNLAQNDEEKPSENIAMFLAFLNRRKAYLLVEKGRLEEAKGLLKRMLKDPASADFAISELAYIQKLEKDKS